MRPLANAYHLGVLWLLSIAARRVVETIYDHGHQDGSTELREWMRKELLAIQGAIVEDRAKAYRQGFNDAMRMYDDEPVAEPVERMH